MERPGVELTLVATGRRLPANPPKSKSKFLRGLSTLLAAFSGNETLASMTSHSREILAAKAVRQLGPENGALVISGVNLNAEVLVSYGLYHNCSPVRPGVARQ